MSLAKHLPDPGAGALQLLLPAGVSKAKRPLLGVFPKCSVKESKRGKWSLLHENMQESTGCRS